MNRIDLNAASAERFVCYVDGSPKTRDFEAAHRSLWKANLGYVRPASWYRYRIVDHEDAFSFAERGIKAAEAEFAFELHRRRLTPVTKEDLFGDRVISNSALAARASRFCKIAFTRLPTGLRPIEPQCVPTDGRAGAGYLIKTGLSYFMVHDLVWDGKPRRPCFDWALFTEPLRSMSR